LAKAKRSAKAVDIAYENKVSLRVARSPNGLHEASQSFLKAISTAFASSSIKAGAKHSPRLAKGAGRAREKRV